MFRAPKSRISRTLLSLLMPVAFMLAPVGAPPAAAALPKALINDATVSGGTGSQEATIAAAAGFAVTVVSDATWGTYTAADFGQYDLLIAGDPTCGSLPPGLIASASVFGPVVLGTAGGRTSPGNRVVVGTDPVFHDTFYPTTLTPAEVAARATIIRDGIAYAGTQPGRTGIYFDATCGAAIDATGVQSAATLSILSALSAGTVSWTIDAAPPCGGNVSLIASNSSFADLTTASLQGWECSVHESFPTFPNDWSALAVATDTASHPTCGLDPADPPGSPQHCGEAYILIAGSNIVVHSQVLSVSPLDATNPVGTTHTVTANVHDVTGTPVQGQVVAFSVTGRNAGAPGSTCAQAGCISDVNGNVTFTYLGAGGPGDDTIKASFTDNVGSLQTATAQKHWRTLSADLSLSKSGSPSPVTAGGDLTYTLTVTNSGPDAAADATVTDTLPAGVTFKSASLGCNNLAGTVTCLLAGPIANGATPQVKIVVTTGLAGAIYNSASVNSSTSDPNLENNSASVNTTVNPGVSQTCPPTQTCTTPPVTSPDGTTASITGGPGSTITASFSTLAAAGFAGCTAFPLPSSLARSVLTLNVTGSKWPKLIKWVQAGPGPVRICWNSPTPFRQRGGGMSPADAKSGYSGVLPDCLSLRPTLPCVSPTVTRAGLSTIWILAPAGDPHGY